jgi:hypothetical protein
MPPLNLPITVFNRPVKPVAFGFSVLMIVLTVVGVTGTGVFGTSILGDVETAVSAVAAAALIGGWIGRSQRIAEIGLLLVFIVYTMRGVFIGLYYGPSKYDMYLSLGAAIIAGGSYLLEHADALGRN